MAIVDPRFLPIAVAGSVPAIVLARTVDRAEWLVFATDSFAIGVYSMVGADKALLLGVPPASAVLIGVLAGTGSSVLADMIVGVPPTLFRPGHLLGVSAALGTVVYVVGTTRTDTQWPWFVLGVALVAITRIASVATGWRIGSADRIPTHLSVLLRPVVSRRARRARGQPGRSGTSLAPSQVAKKPSSS